jgi:hypothetical protein
VSEAGAAVNIGGGGGGGVVVVGSGRSSTRLTDLTRASTGRLPRPSTPPSRASIEVSTSRMPGTTQTGALVVCTGSELFR